MQTFRKCYSDGRDGKQQAQLLQQQLQQAQSLQQYEQAQLQKAQLQKAQLQQAQEQQAQDESSIWAHLPDIQSMHRLDFSSC